MHREVTLNYSHVLHHISIYDDFTALMNKNDETLCGIKNIYIESAIYDTMYWPNFIKIVKRYESCPKCVEKLK